MISSEQKKKLISKLEDYIESRSAQLRDLEDIKKDVWLSVAEYTRALLYSPRSDQELVFWLTEQRERLPSKKSYEIRSRIYEILDETIKIFQPPLYYSTNSNQMRNSSQVRSNWAEFFLSKNALSEVPASISPPVLDDLFANL